MWRTTRPLTGKLTLRPGKPIGGTDIGDASQAALEQSRSTGKPVRFAWDDGEASFTVRPTRRGKRERRRR